MKIQQAKNIGILVLTVGSLLITPATFAKVTPNPTIQAQRIDTIRQQADTDIAKRLDSLNDLITRVKAFKHLNDTQKTEFVNEANTEITALNNLKAKIDADTDLTTIRADRKSIFEDLRIYMLFIPKMHIMASADSVLDITTLFQQLETKLQDRINQAKSSGKDVTALQNALNDIQSKVSDATTQAQNAVSTVSPLMPDKGDKTVMESNKTALQNARNDIKTAQADLKTARNDVQTIRNGLK